MADPNPAPKPHDLPFAPFTTLAQGFLARVDGPDNFRALMVKRAGRFDDIALSEVKSAVFDLAAGLMSLGIGKGGKVVLISENRPEWLYTDYALMLLGAINVPIYPTLTPPLIEYIIKDCAAELVIVSGEVQYRKIQEIRAALPALKGVVLFDPPAAAPAAGDLTLFALLQRGMAAKDRESRVRAVAAAVSEKDLASLVYTSGTTGQPKGVMLSHENFTQNIMGSVQIIQLTGVDKALSLLPLCHTFERVVDYIGFFGGTAIAYAESVDKARDNLAEVHPTVMAGVPRLYEKIFAGFLEGAQQKFIGRLLVDDAVAVARAVAAAKLLAGSPPAGPWMKFKHWLYDKLMYGKLRAKMGGSIHFFISGGAPLSRDHSLFFHGVGLPIVEGYGLSETSPVITMNPREAIRPGSPGRVIPGVELKIAEDGEILTRSRCVMQGYYNQPEKTAEVMKDGWFCTGDVGHLDADGYLFITDRKKDLIKTSGGKYVAPQGVEAALKQSHFIAEASVFGDGRKFVVALLVPDFIQLAAWAKTQGWPETPPAELIKKPEVTALFDREVAAAQQELPHYEQIKKFALLPHEFTLGEGEMTPTMKVRRKVVGEKYKALIEPLFA
jgi:long-chain acyl-CoA synthetase